MHVVIRTDASAAIGTGHLIRCLALAGKLSELDATVTFICRNLEDGLRRLVETHGYAVHTLDFQDDEWQIDASKTRSVIQSFSVKPEWLVVDHYQLGRRWEAAVSDSVSSVMTIDDLADRQHQCDLLLDQNFFRKFEQRYDHLIPPGCIKLLGPEYLMLRGDFLASRENARSRTGFVERILVCFGGADSANHTSDVLHELHRLTGDRYQIDVVCGAANRNLKAIEGLCDLWPNLRLYSHVSNMASLMQQADLAISAGGLTSYELAFMGLPSILIPVTSIQAEASNMLALHGSAVTLGLHTEFPRSRFARILGELLESPSRCLEISASGLRLFDGLGLDRVAKVMMDHTQKQYANQRALT